MRSNRGGILQLKDDENSYRTSIRITVTDHVYVVFNQSMLVSSQSDLQWQSID